MAIIGGRELNDNEHIRNANLAYISGSIASGQGNFGVSTVEGTKYIVRSGRDTITDVQQIWAGSSQVCREVWLSCPSTAMIIKSGSAGEGFNRWGARTQANVVYELPVHNTNTFWISGVNTGSGFYAYWTAWG